MTAIATTFQSPYGDYLVRNQLNGVLEEVVFLKFQSPYGDYLVRNLARIGPTPYLLAKVSVPLRGLLS